MFSCLLIVALWSPAEKGQRADLLALSCVIFFCVFVTFPCSVLGQVWCLIVSIPDCCPFRTASTLFAVTVIELKEKSGKPRSTGRVGNFQFKWTKTLP